MFKAEAAVEPRPYFVSVTASARTFILWLLRLIGIYLAIALIVVGSLLLGSFILVVNFFWFARKSSAERRVEFARRAISRGIRFYLWILDSCGLMKVDFVGFDQLPAKRPLLFVANHPSLWDVLFFMAKFPDCSCIVKQYLYKFSPYSLCIRQADYIVAAKDDVVDKANSEFSQGRSLVVFPEGTRSDAAQVSSSGQLVLHRGAAAIALRNKQPIYPVKISCNPAALGKRQAWYRIPLQKCQVQLTLGPVLQPQNLAGESMAIAARRVTTELETLFSSDFRGSAKSN